MQTTFEKLGITYRQEGDYLLPNIEAPEIRKTTHRVAFSFICARVGLEPILIRQFSELLLASGRTAVVPYFFRKAENTN